MVSFLTTLLAVSIAGLVFLLIFKAIEVSTGRVAFASMRPGVNRFFHKLFLFVERGIPFLTRRAMYRTVKGIKTLVQVWLARVIVWLEHLLQELLHTVRQKTQVPRTRGEVSGFLKEVADYKHQIQKEATHTAEDN